MKGRLDRLCGRCAVELLGSRDRSLRQIGHRRSWEIERARQDDRVGDAVAERLTNVPEGARPDLAVVVNLPVQVAGVVQVEIGPAKTMWDRRGVRGRVPLGDAG